MVVPLAAPSPARSMSCVLWKRGPKTRRRSRPFSRSWRSGASTVRRGCWSSLMGERLATRRAAGFWGFSFGAAVPVAQSGECGQAFIEREPVLLATTAPTSVSAPDLYGSESCVQAPADGTKKLQPIGGSEFGGRPGGNVDVASAGSLCPHWPVLQYHELSGIDQCLGVRAVCQGGSLGELASATTVVGCRVAGY